MNAERSTFTISQDALTKELGKPDLRVVDASWYLPAQNRNARAEYQEKRIPGAVFFDIDAMADTDSPLPHMLPSPEQFAVAAGMLGISETDEIVIYDGPGLMSCARAWWTFRVMGASNVKILDGGFDRWSAAGLPIETGDPPQPATARFKANFAAERVRSIDNIRSIIRSGGTAIYDARSFARFAGRASEPRPGLRSGHIPGSKSLPFDQLIEDGKLKNISALREVFEGLSLRPGEPVVTTCGSGVTAAVITLALDSIGHTNNALYDGSWAEWGQAENAPVARWDD